ncbi:unnamed protein product [Rotaria sp. Silwood1]|nr:unnamed protein product [Rotaria sp. Silwood1]CAF1624248.1 unnamed protein product [Rotaria sp. Silwood1]CAF4940020.1 unnamed protein product [Rotaria sp. Silwood1]
MAQIVISSLVNPCWNVPVCDMYCPYGNRFDANGCEMCACKSSPCNEEATPLEGYFCGDGPNRRECPSTHYCAISPNNAYAVCCPNSHQLPLPLPKEPGTASISKPGKCPPQTGTGDCVAYCTNDFHCPGEKKCCGDCPRACKKPVF